MNATNYTILAYTAGLVALWGYAALLFLEGRRLSRRTMKSP